MEIRLSNASRKREFLPVTLEIKFDTVDEVNLFLFSLTGAKMDSIQPNVIVEEQNIKKIADRLRDELKRQGF